MSLVNVIQHLGEKSGLLKRNLFFFESTSDFDMHTHPKDGSECDCKITSRR